MVAFLETAARVGPCVEAVIVADGLTLGSTMIVKAFALGLSGGPVGAGAFFGYVGIRAAIASGGAALTDPRCK